MLADGFDDLRLFTTFFSDPLTICLYPATVAWSQLRYSDAPLSLSRGHCSNAVKNSAVHLNSWPCCDLIGDKMAVARALTGAVMQAGIIAFVLWGALAVRKSNLFVESRT